MAVSTSALDKTPVNETGHPKGFWFVTGGELFERFAFQGVTTILALYLVERLDFSDGDASRTISYFLAACYLLPLAGGWLADRYFGRYWTIIGFSVPYFVGILLLGRESVPSLIAALLLIALGCGIIKPNVPTLLGTIYDERRPNQERLRSVAFGLFYWAINVGAAVGAVLLPSIRTEWGYSIAFLFAAAVMAMAWGAFAAGKKSYPQGASPKAERANEQHPGKPRLGRLFVLFVVMVLFWSIFEQRLTTWILFTRAHVDLQISEWTLDADLIQAVNPVMVLVFLPVLAWLWQIQASRGKDWHHTHRMIAGFVLTTLCMVVMSVAGFCTTGEVRIALGWVVCALIMITCAEVCIVPTALDLCFRIAPGTMKSTIMACQLLSVFLGHILNAQITPCYEDLGAGMYFGILAAALVPVTLIFWAVAYHMDRSE